MPILIPAILPATAIMFIAARGFGRAPARLAGRDFVYPPIYDSWRGRPPRYGRRRWAAVPVRVLGPRGPNALCIAGRRFHTVGGGFSPSAFRRALALARFALCASPLPSFGLGLIFLASELVMAPFRLFDIADPLPGPLAGMLCRPGAASRSPSYPQPW